MVPTNVFCNSSLISFIDNLPMIKLNHLPFLMTSFIPSSSAAVIPKPMTKIKINLMSLQISVAQPKNHKLPSGKIQRSETSTIPIHILGTKEVIENSCYPKKMFTYQKTILRDDQAKSLLL